MTETDQDRLFGQHSSLQDKLVIPRRFGLSRGTPHTIRCRDRNTCYGQFLLRVGIALRHCAFNRDQSMDGDGSQVCAQKQRNDYSCRNCDHHPDNFLSRHAAPANNWTRTLEYMLPVTILTRTSIGASIIQYKVCPKSVAWANTDGLNEHG